MSTQTECPICDFNLEMLGDTLVGELIECTDCGTELEVIETVPFTVEEAPTEDEDWGQ